MAHDFERLVCGPVPLHHASHGPPPHAGEDRSMIQLAAFYLFAFVVIASAAMVIFARNPVHSVMWLILAFFNAAGLRSEESRVGKEWVSKCSSRWAPDH